ncbi:MAG: Rqc2 family fibronectin-binding protein [Candidatus Polarisedimenticolia bacterium]
MDPFLLRAVITEAADRLLESELRRVAHLGRHRYLLRFATTAHDNLLISVRPDLPRLHLLPRGARAREEPPDPFAAILDREIGGAILTAIEKRPWDRVVTLRFRLPGAGGEAPAAAAPRSGPAATGAPERAERVVVAELLGRSSNVYLLDAEGTIRAFSRPLRSAFRGPVEGIRYEPPPGREEFAGLPETPEALPVLEARGGTLAALERVSPLFGRAARSDPAIPSALLRATATGTWSPVVYSRRPLAELEGGPPPGADDVVASPLPVPIFPDHVVLQCTGPSEAAARVFGAVEAIRDFNDLRAHHAALVRREIARLRVLAGKLEGELDGARDTDLHRRQGEALLAGLRVARIEGDRAIVPDPYDSGGASLPIPIDPARTLAENAETLFGRFKKGKRALAAIGARLEAVRARLEEWRALAAPAEIVRTPEDLDALREAMARLGLVHARPATRRAAASRPPGPPARVRRHTSADGLEILVGRSGDENDTLTFRVASPWDFWLHAAGRPGAHVIVRNPKRLKTIPDATLREAAAIAAHYSDARAEGKVEVHYTQRKHVHKRKGMPAGQVLLRRFRSIQIAPRLPVPSVTDV